MSDLANAILAHTQRARATIDVATMVDDSTTVSVGGQNVMLAKCLSGYTPEEGDEVLIARQGARIHVLGALVDAEPAKPSQATIEAIQANLTPAIATVSTDQGTWRLPYLATAMAGGAQGGPIAVGDTVQIVWLLDGTGLILGRVASYEPPPPPPPKPAPARPKPPVAAKPPPPPPPKPPQTGQTTFVITRQSTWRGGWRTDTDQAIQGVAPGYPGNNQGSWFYGGKPYDTLKGATITAAWVYLSRASGGVFASQAVHLYQHGSASRPAGNVSFGAGPHNVGLAVGEAKWVAIPVSWGQALISGRNHGLGVSGNPYVRLNGRSATAQAGSLRLQWRR